MIDEELKAWVLEVNANPSLGIHREGTTGREEDICPVDLHVKE